MILLTLSPGSPGGPGSPGNPMGPCGEKKKPELKPINCVALPSKRWMTHNGAFRSIFSWYSSRSRRPRSSRKARVPLLTYIPFSTLTVMQINWQAMKRQGKEEQEDGRTNGGSSAHNNTKLSNGPRVPNVTIITLPAKLHIQHHKNTLCTHKHTRRAVADGER